MNRLKRAWYALQCAVAWGFIEYMEAVNYGPKEQK